MSGHSATGMIGFIFPGQGSQHPGMGGPWKFHPSWEIVEEASDITGRNVEKLLLDADAAELRHTDNTQLATFVQSLVILDAVEQLGVEPGIVAGHSLGEYTALVAAGVFSFTDGIRAVDVRGTQLAEIVRNSPTSGMAAVIGMADEDVVAVCESVEGEVWAVNFNNPGQVIIAGLDEPLARAVDALRAAGAKKVLQVPVAGAGHTPFTRWAAEPVREALESLEIRDASVPVVSNLDAAMHTAGADFLEILPRHLWNPVLWHQSLATMADYGARTFVEIGPGSVLGGTVKRTLSDVATISVSQPGDLDTLLELLGELPQVDLAPMLQGEHLFTTERMVVSPAAGVFQATPEAREGGVVEVGAALGSVGDEDVRSPFRGQLLKFLAVDGERVTVTQPIAWLRTA